MIEPQALYETDATILGCKLYFKADNKHQAEMALRVVDQMVRDKYTMYAKEPNHGAPKEQCTGGD